MNIYWIKIKLRAAVNQAIYLVIFSLGSRNYISQFTNFTTRPRDRGSDQSRYMPVNVFFLN